MPALDLASPCLSWCEGMKGTLSGVLSSKGSIRAKRTFFLAPSSEVIPSAWSGRVSPSQQRHPVVHR